MIRLSKNFSLDEMVHTTHNIENLPSIEVVCNLSYGVNNILQPLRDFLGKPILINSGFRCKSLNSKVGGVINSQHLYGEAADISLTSEDIKKSLIWLRACKFCDQVLVGKSFMHISWCINRTPRQMYVDNYYNY